MASSCAKTLEKEWARWNHYERLLTWPVIRQLRSVDSLSLHVQSEFQHPLPDPCMPSRFSFPPLEAWHSTLFTAPNPSVICTCSKCFTGQSPRILDTGMGTYILSFTISQGTCSGLFNTFAKLARLRRTEELRYRFEG